MVERKLVESVATPVDAPTNNLSTGRVGTQPPPTRWRLKLLEKGKHVSRYMTTHTCSAPEKQ